MIAKKIEKLAPSGIRQFFDLVLGMPDVISLGVGEPDFNSPWRVVEKAITALEEEMTSYTSNKGLFILRSSIHRHYKKKYNLEYDSEKEILITVGVSQALDFVLRAILNPKDKVIVVSPHYVAYPALVEMAGGKPLYLPTKQQEHFKINPRELSELVKQNPKAIILNYPCNPTGVTYNKEELREIWRILSKKEIIVLSDEVYEDLTYDFKHFPFANLDSKAKERTVFLSGFSKGYAMTGFRVGFACGNERIIEAMTKIASFAVLCGPIVSQVAAVEALKAQTEVERMKKEYHLRRDFLTKEFNRIGLDVFKPQGAFYLFPSIKQFEINSMDFAKRLLFEEKVAVVPGTAFGKEAEGYLRVSYANTLENLKEAVIRIERFLKKLK